MRLIKLAINDPVIPLMTWSHAHELSALLCLLSPLNVDAPNPKEQLCITKPPRDMHRSNAGSRSVDAGRRALKIWVYLSLAFHVSECVVRASPFVRVSVIVALTSFLLFLLFWISWYCCSSDIIWLNSMSCLVEAPYADQGGNSMAKNAHHHHHFSSTRL